MIPKKYLLLLAGLVWGAAGFNILRLGLLAYVGLVKPLYLLLSAAVFVIFQKMVFGKLVQKHTARILTYETPKVWFWHFFDRKSFLIMAFMMTMGHFPAEIFTGTHRLHCFFLHWSGGIPAVGWDFIPAAIFPDTD